MNQDVCNFKPGWQILEEAAHAALGAEPNQEPARFLEVQLLARANELIPDEHKTRIVPLLVAACCHVYQSAQFWPFLLADFFQSQVGREGLEPLLLTHSNWQTQDHRQPTSGYLVVNTGYRAPIGADDIRAAQALDIRGHLERGKSGLLVVTRG